MIVSDGVDVSPFELKRMLDATNSRSIRESALYAGFLWHSTPQGDSFWDNETLLMFETGNLSEEATAILQKWKNEIVAAGEWPLDPPTVTAPAVT